MVRVGKMSNLRSQKRALTPQRLLNNTSSPFPRGKYLNSRKWFFLSIFYVCYTS